MRIYFRSSWKGSDVPCVFFFSALHASAGLAMHAVPTALAMHAVPTAMLCRPHQTGSAYMHLERTPGAMISGGLAIWRFLTSHESLGFRVYFTGGASDRRGVPAPRPPRGAAAVPADRLRAGSRGARLPGAARRGASRPSCFLLLPPAAGGRRLRLQRVPQRVLHTGEWMLHVRHGVCHAARRAGGAQAACAGGGLMRWRGGSPTRLSGAAALMAAKVKAGGVGDISGPVAPGVGNGGGNGSGGIRGHLRQHEDLRDTAR